MGQWTLQSLGKSVRGNFQDRRRGQNFLSCPGARGSRLVARPGAAATLVNFIFRAGATSGMTFIFFLNIFYQTASRLLGREFLNVSLSKLTIIIPRYLIRCICLSFRFGRLLEVTNHPVFVAKIKKTAVEAARSSSGRCRRPPESDIPEMPRKPRIRLVTIRTRDSTTVSRSERHFVQLNKYYSIPKQSLARRLLKVY